MRRIPAIGNTSAWGRRRWRSCSTALDSVIGGCMWCSSSSPTSRWSTCWVRESWPRTASDDCLGRTLDWLYAHDVTRLFAGLALRARRAFGVEVERLHADTTSFSVHGQYAPDGPGGQEAPSGTSADASALAEAEAEAVE